MGRSTSFRLAVALLALLLGTVPVSAVGSGSLTPALAHLSAAVSMVRTGLPETEIGFSREHFADALGTCPASVTITSLPPAVEGTLYFGATPVSVNQKISAASLSGLRFVPTAGSVGSSFRFRGEGPYSHVCTIRTAERVNLAPETVSASTVQGVADTDLLPVWTQRDIGVWGRLPAADPEGDRLQYEIVAYPTMGLLTMLDTAAGTYSYTPYEGALGSDTFTYRVRDSYGNYSAPRTVEVSIAEPVTTLVFADMEEHWAENAAMVMAAAGCMEVYPAGAELYFRPEDPMTREEYLVTVMKALGAGEIAPGSTGFADEAAMDPSATGYIARARELGIVRGSEVDGELYFRPTEVVTRAEGAVILNAILGAETPEVLPVFADASAIPAWAAPSLYALNGLGVLRGMGDGELSPTSTLNRGQTAQMLLTVKRLMEG